MVSRNKDNVPNWSDMSFPRTVVSLSYYDTNSTKHVVLVQSRHHLIKMHFVLAMIDLNNCLLEVRQQSLAHYYEVYKGCHRQPYSTRVYNSNIQSSLPMWSPLKVVTFFLS